MFVGDLRGSRGRTLIGIEAYSRDMNEKYSLFMHLINVGSRVYPFYIFIIFKITLLVLGLAHLVFFLIRIQILNPHFETFLSNSQVFSCTCFYCSKAKLVRRAFNLNVSVDKNVEKRVTQIQTALGKTEYRVA